MEEGIIQERPDEMALCGSEGKKSFLLSLPFLPTFLALFDGYSGAHLSSTWE